eukprot:COSAG02_NODE_121_length_35326_cov_25.450819_18_plen_92_part_00
MRPRPRGDDSIFDTLAQRTAREDAERAKAKQRDAASWRRANQRARAQCVRQARACIGRVRGGRVRGERVRGGRVWARAGAPAVDSIPVYGK